MKSDWCLIDSSEMLIELNELIAWKKRILQSIFLRKTKVKKCRTEFSSCLKKYSLLPRRMTGMFNICVNVQSIKKFKQNFVQFSVQYQQVKQYTSHIFQSVYKFQVFYRRWKVCMTHNSISIISTSIEMRIPIRTPHLECKLFAFRNCIFWSFVSC